MTQQGLRQASARDLSGFATETNYNEDLLRLFDAQSIPAGTFNERQLRWINARMAASYTNLTEAMQAYATSQGASNWSSMGAFESVSNFTRTMPFGSVYTRTGSATGVAVSGAIETFAANAPQRTNRGLTLEPAATNILPNTVFANSGGGAPTSWTQPVATGTSVPATSTRNAAVVAYSQTATAERPYIGVSVTFSTNTTYQISMIIESITGTLAPSQVLWFSAFPAGSTTTFPVCEANPTGGAAGVITTGLMVMQLAIAGTGGTQTLRMGLGGSGGATGTIRFSCPQMETGAFQTSYIPTTATAETRGLPVFTETVPVGYTKALLVYADATTTLITSLVAGAVLNFVTSIVAASKGRFGSSELVSRTWQA